MFLQIILCSQITDVTTDFTFIAFAAEKKFKVKTNDKILYYYVNHDQVIKESDLSNRESNTELISRSVKVSHQE